MPIKGSEERTQNYLRKLNPERVKEQLEKRLDSMAAKQSDRIAQLATIEDGVKAILSHEDIPTMAYILYYDFARQVYAAQRRIGGGKGLVREVNLLTYKWHDRGASEEVLDKIRFGVFAIEKS